LRLLIGTSMQTGTCHKPVNVKAHLFAHQVYDSTQILAIIFRRSLGYRVRFSLVPENCPYSVGSKPSRPEPSVIKARKVKKRLEIPCYKG
jgi:hypothetical protein